MGAPPPPISILPSSRDGFRGDRNFSARSQRRVGLNPSFLQGWVSSVFFWADRHDPRPRLNPSFLQGWVSRGWRRRSRASCGISSQSFLPPGMGFEQARRSDQAGQQGAESQSFLPPGMGFEQILDGAEVVTETTSQSFLPPGMGFESWHPRSGRQEASGLNPSFLQGWVSSRDMGEPAERRAEGLNPSFLQGWVSSRRPPPDQRNTATYGLNPSFLQGWVSSPIGLCLDLNVDMWSQSFLPPGMGFEGNTAVTICSRGSTSQSFLPPGMGFERWSRSTVRAPTGTSLNPSFLQGWVSSPASAAYDRPSRVRLNPSFLQGWVSRTREHGVGVSLRLRSQSFLPPGMGFEMEIPRTFARERSASQSFLPPGMGFEWWSRGASRRSNEISLNPSFLQGWVSSCCDGDTYHRRTSESQSFLPPGMGFEHLRTGTVRVEQTVLSQSFLPPGMGFERGRRRVGPDDAARSQSFLPPGMGFETRRVSRRVWLLKEVSILPSSRDGFRASACAAPRQK